jgi:hypothetical protein
MRRFEVCGNEVEVSWDEGWRLWFAQINGMEPKRGYDLESEAEAAAREWCEANPYPED